MKFTIGDIIEVNSRQVGGQVRRGKVVEVVDPGRPELRVAWDDQRESVLYPSGGMVRVVGRDSG